ncbi:MAG: cytochrome C [Deltaproteobacteria bacterium]|nr:MAG: cytochrome C [Deltaproteobacteria bacterium]
MTRQGRHHHLSGAHRAHSVYRGRLVGLLVFPLALAVVAGGSRDGHAAAPKPDRAAADKAGPAKTDARPLDAKLATSGHAPYEMGECSVCHKTDDPKHPGPLQGPVRDLCAGCHEEMEATLANSRHPHKAAVDNCVACHNPHNAAAEHLLRGPMPGLCVGCHDKIGKAMAGAVKHAPVSEGKSCLSCHDPHASNVAKGLLAQPFDLCVSCHGKPDVKDPAGVTLTNFAALLEANPHHHGPIGDKDCSACHETHGGANFRLLSAPYPATFYEGWDEARYELCFTCHDVEAFTAEKTTTATAFRDGDRNLHFLHVNMEKRGRTCRACHEVHASPQPFQIRTSVPYGSKGWQLHLNFEERPNGGACSKTCHVTKSYDNGRK